MYYFVCFPLVHRTGYSFRFFAASTRALYALYCVRRMGNEKASIAFQTVSMIQNVKMFTTIFMLSAL